jgi:hypothetical protein
MEAILIAIKTNNLKLPTCYHDSVPWKGVNKLGKTKRVEQGQSWLMCALFTLEVKVLISAEPENFLLFDTNT